MDDLIGKTKHEIEDILNARAPECPPDVSAADYWNALRERDARIEVLENERDGLREKLEVAEEVAHADGTRADRLAALLKEAEEREAALMAELTRYADWMLACPPVSDRVREHLTHFARLEAREVGQ